jgi:predicted ATPase
MITQFRVKNFKALRDITLDLTPLHVLIGPNDSGKSSVLQAMAALSRAMRHRIPECFPGAWSGRQLTWCMDDLEVSFEADLRDATGAFAYALDLGFPASEVEVQVKGERVTDGTGRAHALPHDHDRTAVSVRIERHFTDDAAALVDRVNDALLGAQLYRWNPRLLSLPAAHQAGGQFEMHVSGFGLPLMLDDILGFDRALYARIEDAFRTLFPDVRSIKLVRTNGFKASLDGLESIPMLNRAPGKGIEFEFARSGRILPASQVSDGMLLMLAYLTVLHLPEPPRVLLIEEPENGIHPRRLQEVVKMLRKVVQDADATQILMTTHSPYVLDFFQPDEVTMCRRDGQGAAQLRRLKDSQTVREQLDVFSLGEIWTAEGEDKIAQDDASAEASR